MTERLHLRLTPDTLSVWRCVASRFGYVADRGPLKGEGAVGPLLEAVASSEVALADLVEAFADAGSDMADTYEDSVRSMAEGTVRLLQQATDAYEELAHEMAAVPEELTRQVFDVCQKLAESVSRCRST